MTLQSKQQRQKGTIQTMPNNVFPLNIPMCRKSFLFPMLYVSSFLKGAEETYVSSFLKGAEETY